MKRFHIECLTEEVLLLNLNLTRDDIMHHSGSGAVCKKLEEGENLVGLIDEDPERTTQHPYYGKLYGKADSDDHNIRFVLDKEKNNKLIFIKPRFEPWIIGVAQKSGLQMSDYKLSDDPDILHRDVISKKADLQMLLHQLIKLKSPALMRIRELIKV